MAGEVITIARHADARSGKLAPKMTCQLKTKREQAMHRAPVAGSCGSSLLERVAGTTKMSHPRMTTSSTAVRECHKKEREQQLRPSVDFYEVDSADTRGTEYLLARLSRTSSVLSLE